MLYRMSVLSKLNATEDDVLKPRLLYARHQPIHACRLYVTPFEDVLNSNYPRVQPVMMVIYVLLKIDVIVEFASEDATNVNPVHASSPHVMPRLENVSSSPNQMVVSAMMATPVRSGVSA